MASPPPPPLGDAVAAKEAGNKAFAKGELEQAHKVRESGGEKSNWLML